MGAKRGDDESKKMNKPASTHTQRRSMSSGLSLSVTRKEIDKFWRIKKVIEENHFLAAIKAASSLHLRPKPKEEEYRQNMESGEDKTTTITRANNKLTSNAPSDFEIRTGIKDWWTKSKYAYLNQPALGMWFYKLNN